MNLTENTGCVPTGNTQSLNDVNLVKDTMRISGIYKIVNKINGKYYVGSSIDIHCRWRKHKEALNRNQHRNRYLQRAWNKYGNDTFVFSIIEYSIPSSLESVEQTHLNVAKAELTKCYNLSFTSDRIEMTPSVKSILSRMAKERLKDKTKHPFYGKKLSKEHIAKINPIGKTKGSKNGRFDPKTYVFSNINGEIFVGTRYDFCQKYAIHSSRISTILLKIGRSKRIRGWDVKPF